MPKLRPIALLLTALLPACADLDPEALDPADQDLEYRCPDCGSPPGSFNTDGNNGLLSSAMDIYGEAHDGWRLGGVAVRSEGGQAIMLESVHVENGILYGVDEYGATWSGADFVGSVWTMEIDVDYFEVPPQEEVEWVEWVMVIQDFIPDGPRSRYVLTNGPTPQQAEDFKCLMDDETGEFSAILYTDLDVDKQTGLHSERPNTIYFGCIAGAIGKAGMWGYPQHEFGLEVHQAATRMIRADYCGTGTSYTQTGTLIQRQDALNISSFDPGGESEATEAMWTAGGAACLLEPRRPEYDYEAVTCNGQLLPMCGAQDDLEDWGAVMWTKVVTLAP